MKSIQSDTEVVFKRLYPNRGVISHGRPAQAASIDYKELDSILAVAHNDRELFERIVNAPFDQYKVQTSFFFLGFISLVLVNNETGTIDRIALSNTDLAKRTAQAVPIPFNRIRIKVNDPENIIAAAIRTGTMQDTTDWRFLTVPVLTPQQARIKQAGAGIAYSAVYPLKARNGGALIYSYYQYRELIDDLQHDFMKKYSRFVTKRLTQSY